MQIFKERVLQNKKGGIFRYPPLFNYLEMRKF
jgi:hypothetical protein